MYNWGAEDNGRNLENRWYGRRREFRWDQQLIKEMKEHGELEKKKRLNVSKIHR